MGGGPSRDDVDGKNSSRAGGNHFQEKNKRGGREKHEQIINSSNLNDYTLVTGNIHVTIMR